MKFICLLILAVILISPVEAEHPNIVSVMADNRYQSYRELVDFSDFLHPLLELSDADFRAGVPIAGQSFAPTILDQPGPARLWVHSEHKGKHRVRNEKWKLYDDQPFFNMQNDPTEPHPLEIISADSEPGRVHTSLAKVLHTLLDSESRSS